jgi:molybdenum cofactor guanylyltransferase
MSSDRKYRVTGAIIAGGAASRFSGEPKGLKRVGGVRIIDRIAASLQVHCQSLLIASGDAEASDWIPGARIAPDLLGTRASVTGIHAALTAAEGAIIAVAWDMPFVPESLIGAMCARLAAGATAVVPRTTDGPEPLCAGYAARARPMIESCIRGGRLKLIEILSTLPEVEWIEQDALDALGAPGITFFNVNTPADLERAEEIARSL